MGAHGALEVAKTVIEVADVAWTAMECCHHHSHAHGHDNKIQESTHKTPLTSPCQDDLESLRAENRRLRNVLEKNLQLLHQLSDSPTVLRDCPPDLYVRLVSTVNSENYLANLRSLQQATAKGTGTQFPFKEATEVDCRSADILINVDQKEPSWWVWVTDEMVPSNLEEGSGIDDENYVIITDEHVIDGVAIFMATCIMSNPKALNLSPEELQKNYRMVAIRILMWYKQILGPFGQTIWPFSFFMFPQYAIAKSLDGVSKMEKIFRIWYAGTMFYTLSTWGLALVGLYNTRGVLKLAAKGVHVTSKAALKVL